MVEGKTVSVIRKGLLLRPRRSREKQSLTFLSRFINNRPLLLWRRLLHSPARMLAGSFAMTGLEISSIDRRTQLPA